MTIAQESELISKGSTRKLGRTSVFETALVLILVWVTAVQIFEIAALFNLDKTMQMVFPDAGFTRRLWSFLYMCLILGFMSITAPAGFITSFSWLFLSKEENLLERLFALFMGTLAGAVAFGMLNLDSVGFKMSFITFMYWFQVGLSFGILFVLAVKKVQGFLKAKT